MNVKLRTLYDAAIAGMECGSMSSFVVESGSWEAGWRGADAGKRNAFGGVVIVDRYAADEREEDPSSPEPVRGHLTDAALRRGLQVLADKYPRIAGAIVSEDSDAASGDALLQCAILGDVIYG